MNRPKLRPGVRLVYDHVRERHALLHPEGVQFLNQTAVDVLKRCDGKLTLTELLAELRESYHGVSELDVRAMLQQLAGSGLVEVIDD